MEFHHYFPSMERFAGSSLLYYRSFMRKLHGSGRVLRRWKIMAPVSEYESQSTGRIPENALVSYEWRTFCILTRNPLLAPIRDWSFGRWRARRDGRREPHKVFFEHIASKWDLLEGAPFPRSFHLDLWKRRCEDESVYALWLSVMRGLIEEWASMSVNAEEHEHAVLWIHSRLQVDYKTAKKATTDFWADTVFYGRRRRTDSG